MLIFSIFSPIYGFHSHALPIKCDIILWCAGFSSLYRGYIKMKECVHVLVCIFLLYHKV